MQYRVSESTVCMYVRMNECIEILFYVPSLGRDDVRGLQGDKIYIGAHQ
jgi:hypothetical protein